MFYGTPYFKPISGSWNEQVGYLFFNPTLADATKIIRRGIFLDYKVGSVVEADFGASAGSTAVGGIGALGFMTQDMTLGGLTIENFAVTGNKDYPLKPGDYVALRRPSLGAEFEVEGLGAYSDNVNGNLLVTSGTGAIASGTVRGTQLGLKGGCWYVAQTNDRVMAELIAANLTPEIGGNVRVLLRWMGGLSLKQP